MQEYIQNKYLIVAYPCCGKTFLAENYKNVCDLEFQHYRWDYGKYKVLPLEQIKGRKDIRTNNPKWPKNFFDILDKAIEKYEIVCVPMATSLFEHISWLVENKNIKCIYIIPNEERFKEIIKTYIVRNNGKQFIESRKKDYLKFLEVVQNTRFDKIFMNKGEYLSDVLKAKGLQLKEGKGFKNYI